MAVAAGGNIVQSIVRDPFSATDWKKEATVVFNVQMLNASFFESVTGTAAPPTPVTAKSYADAGLPFFELYEEPSSVSGKAVFDKVKSIAAIDGKEESNYKFPVKALNEKQPAAGRKRKTVSEDSESDTLVNPAGPYSEFRHISEIEAELAKLKVEHD